MGNTSSERAAMGHGEKSQRRDSRGIKEGERPKILMDSPEDADIFHGEDIKAPSEKDEFLAWQQDLEAEDKDPNLDRPTVFRWTGDGKEVFVSGSFNNWANKIPLIRSQNTFVAIVDLPEGEHQYKFYVDGQWTHDPTEPVITSQLGTVNNIIQVKKTDFEVFDALMVDSQKSSDMSDLSSSPPGPYHQDPYVPKQEEKFKSPPILPPHLLQVILNKDTGISCDPALLPEPNHVMLNHLYALSIKDSSLQVSPAWMLVRVLQQSGGNLKLCQAVLLPPATPQATVLSSYPPSHTNFSGRKIKLITGTYLSPILVLVLGFSVWVCQSFKS